MDIYRTESILHDHLKISKDLPVECPKELSVSIGHEVPLVLSSKKRFEYNLNLVLNTSWTVLKLTPERITLRKEKDSQVQVNVTGLSLSSRTYIEIQNCSLVFDNGSFADICPFDPLDFFIPVTVVRSKTISVLVILSGWIYFVAWSISFYPQIILNFQRKSVIGLNFDFLLLNVIGFSCYTVYNVLLYFDPNVQRIYIERHGQRSLIPVLINDVVFASHALLACIITGVQCFFYERGNQRISYIGRAWASLLLCFSSVSLALALFRVLNWLDFINYLSYSKMAVTLSKYFPQAILNFKRKSTVGWSIGNVLLDFSGGFMDICQMCLQATNTNDWSAFTGNPVKFGLGLISMLFDILFIIQHYVLYNKKVFLPFSVSHRFASFHDVISSSSSNRVDNSHAITATTLPPPLTAASPMDYHPQIVNESTPIISHGTE
ncbi:hypothetical protein niasHS_002597 [Heterodera schachtii]|uniref:Cystinosin homolog n=1 Tax=Heterodera schachtii TaxID=97005 RepID=A0ABD2KKF7_HETSC